MKLRHKHSDGVIAMSYIHLTTTERVKIETYLELGMSIRSIARRLGRQPSGRSDGTPTTWLNVPRNATRR
ncbi:MULTISPECIES: helix-turn-helix domain-containing protein [unclassified Exiguobacterium]|uniref:helix-turn-helix domain-containing protein n=2 Tax=unclassified Exiguobacterium TaxID=2644629 RepID=UPI00333E0D2C